MKITKIKVNNFRLLREFTLTPQGDMSLIIGKNNTAKTSLLTVLDKFINYQDAKKFTFNDLNIQAQEELKDYLQEKLTQESKYEPIKISLEIYISYSQDDDIKRLSRLFVDLDPENNTVVLAYEYTLNYENFLNMKKDLTNLISEIDKKDIDGLNKDIDGLNKDIDGLNKDIDGLNKNIIVNKFFDFGIHKYFRHEIKSLQFDPKLNSCICNSYINIKSANSIQDIISFCYISAKREVSNKQNNNTLSQQVVDIFNTNQNNILMEDPFKNLRKALIRSDHEISKVYSSIFSELDNVVKNFGGGPDEDSSIQVISNLQPDEILRNNAQIVCKNKGQNLPEHYNGLGYMNLLSILLSLDTTLNRIRGGTLETPADINLLFIEEPEVHTHPQMQYIFIKNIKALIAEKLMREDKILVNLQCFISTHSAHIVANCDFNDIKYLKRIKNDSDDYVEAKNINELQKLYEKNEKNKKNGKNAYKFLTQYLTVNCSELFFTEKAIFVEGVSERILLPSMMKKLDALNTSSLPLLSQNISIIDAPGSHSQIFANFIHFIGLKSLIITDIDTYYKDEKDKHIVCLPSHEKATHTANNALKFFHCLEHDEACDYLLKANQDNKIVGYDPIKNEWKKMKDGNVFTAYQSGKDSKSSGYSFEDTFIEENKDFIMKHGENFASLRKNKFESFKNDKNAFLLAQKGIIKKSSFALDLLLYDSFFGADDPEQKNIEPKDSWKVPGYIHEGLEWLAKP